MPRNSRKRCAQGRSGIGPIESTDTSQLRFQNGAEVRGYSHQPYFDDRRADFIDRFAQFAVIAAREAVADAGRGMDARTARERRHRHRLLRGRAEHRGHRLPGSL